MKSSYSQWLRFFVLLQVEDTADVTLGGVVLPEVAKERPLIGTIVSTGSGKWDKETGQVKAMVVRRAQRKL